MNVVTPSESSPDDPAAPTAAPGPRPRRGLDARTLAWVIALAAVVAALAALVTFRALGGGDDTAGSTPEGTLVPSGRAKGADVLGATVITQQGRRTTLADQRDATRPLLVNLWARDCVPCVDEMPLLERLHAGRDDVEVIGVNELDPLGKAEEQAERTGITYAWFRDPDGSFANAARSTGLPASILISPAGTVLAAKVGAFDDLAELEGWLADHGVAP